MADELLKGFAQAEINTQKAKKDIEHELSRQKQKHEPKAPKQTDETKNTTEDHYTQKPQRQHRGGYSKENQDGNRVFEYRGGGRGNYRSKGDYNRENRNFEDRDTTQGE